MLLIGLAVGVDYSLFYLKREREERAAGRSEEAALEAAAATSGRSVLVSGLTVMVAMAGMLLTGDATFASFGVATMIVVAVAMLGSLTVLPAVLSKLGDKVDRGRVPFFAPASPRRTARAASGARSSTACCAAPWSRSCSPAGCCSPSPHRRCSCTRRSRASTRSRRTCSTTYNRLQAAFPGTEISADVVVKAADVESPEVQDGDRRAERRRRSPPGVMNQPIDVDSTRRRHGRRRLDPGRGQRQRRTSNAALDALRDDIVPATVGHPAGRRGRRHRRRPPSRRTSTAR